MHDLDLGLLPAELLQGLSLFLDVLGVLPVVPVTGLSLGALLLLVPVLSSHLTSGLCSLALRPVLLLLVTELDWFLELSLGYGLLLFICELASLGSLLYSDSQLNSFEVQVTIQATMESIVVCLYVFSCLGYDFLVPVHQVVDEPIWLVRHKAEFDPLGQVTWSYFHASLEVVSVVLSSTGDGQSEVRLSQVLVLEASRGLQDDGHKYKVDEDPDYQVAPVGVRLRAETHSSRNDD